jgi:glycerophosphoryl diester phosphodiesterase
VARPHCAAPPVIAHRGDGAPVATPFPENTSAAEVDAVRHGASMMNVDVRWTADDVPVAVHDATLDRTTTVAGHGVAVLSVTAAQFTALWAKNNDGTPYAGHIHPQTLAQLLSAVRGTGLPLVIQMEADPFAPGGAGQASISRLASVIEDAGYADRTVVGGWNVADVRAFAGAAPGVRTAFIQEALSPSSAPAASAVAASGAHILYIDYLGVTASLVSSWHQAGLAVWVWTPAYPPQWSALRTAGVDAIATNWVPSYVQWAGGACPATLN